MSEQLKKVENHKAHLKELNNEINKTAEDERVEAEERIRSKLKELTRKSLDSFVGRSRSYGLETFNENNPKRTI